MKALIHYLSFSLMLLLFNCNVTPKPIAYGSDACHFCRMTIVDKVHAAEVVTNKGKVYKFDATECMLNFMKEFDTAEIKLFLANDYLEPESLIDGTKATFLISKKIPSPMGAFLSAFKSHEEAKSIQSQKGGQLYTWENLQKKFNN